MSEPVSGRRWWMLSAVSMIVLAVAATVLGLRPFSFDTNDVATSLRDFERNRAIRMNGGMIRVAYAFAAIAFAGGLGARFRRRTRAGSAAASVVIGAAFWAIAGIITVVIGVPAEEYRRGIRGEEVLVLADVLFWLQDNLVTVGTLITAAGVAAFSWRWRSSRTGVGLAVATGLLMLPAAALSAAAFYVRGEFGEDPIWYFPSVVAAIAAFAVWIVGVVVTPASESTAAQAPGP